MCINWHSVQQGSTIKIMSCRTRLSSINYAFTSVCMLLCEWVCTCVCVCNEGVEGLYHQSTTHTHTHTHTHTISDAPNLVARLQTKPSPRHLVSTSGGCGGQSWRRTPWQHKCRGHHGSSTAAGPRNRHDNTPPLS